MKVFPLLTFAFCLPLLTGLEAAPAKDPFAEGVRTTPWLSPEDEQKSFHLPPGFEMQLVAAEPDILKPMNMAFDPRGRIWVTVTREYPYPAPVDKPGRDAIKVLEDTDGDGKADKISTFADGLNIPIGIYPYGNGCIAWSIPNIWYFQDTDGDGKADKRDILYGPMGWERDTHGNNASFRRGFDGWIYATHGYNNTTKVKGRDGHEIRMNSGNTYRFQTDGTRIENHTFGQVNPFGLSWDPLGNLYSADCHSAPVYQLLQGGYYPSFGKPHDGLGFAPTMIEHAHGSTAICGIMHYSDSLWPAEYRDNVFIGNVMTSRVNRDELKETGSTKTAKELPDFVRTDDPWFRPVDLQLGPDGALYILDFYNRIIGHYEVPLEHPGRDRTSGRIWRIVYRGNDGKLKLHPRRPDLTRSSSAELVRAMADPNITYRMLAMNELVDRYGSKATEDVRSAAERPANAEQHVHVLWTLHRLGKLSEELLVKAAGNEDRAVRTHVYRILTAMPELRAASRAKAIAALEDADGFVRRTAAETLAAHPQPENLPALLKLRERTSGADTHTMYVARKAIRDQLLNPAHITAAEKMDWTEKQMRVLADVTTAITNPAAGSFLLAYVQKYNESRENQTRYLRHVARYCPQDKMDDVAQISRAKVGDDLDLQVALFKAVQEGTSQRGMSLSRVSADWGTELANKLVAPGAADLDWQNSPIEGMTDTKNPWFVQKRASSDGNKNGRFLCSLPPGGEHLTGLLRSKEFTVPPALTFFLAGHDGFPDKPPQKKNLVRLRLVKSGEILKTTYPPRNDEAQKVNWDLAEHAGKSAVLEVLDADAGSAYAWLAIGRFDPPVISVPATDAKDLTERQRTAAELVKTLKLHHLQSYAAGWVTNTQADLEVRIAMADALVALQNNDAVGSLLPVAADSATPAPLRQMIFLAAARKNERAAEEIAAEAWRTLPRRLQTKVAQALAGSPAGANLLLSMTDQKLAPAVLLLDRSVKDKILAAKISGGEEKLSRLTKDLTPPSDQAQKLIERRSKAYSPVKASSVRGLKVFTQNCAACHQIDGQGSVIGPQLDGIGNRGLERVCEDILDPNRNVDPAFRSTLLVLKDGDVVSGLFRREEGGVVILADSAGKELQVKKETVAERRQSETSLMPENFAELISEGDFQDLLAYLLSKGSSAPQAEAKAR